MKPRVAPIVRNTGWMTLALAVAAILQAVYFVVVARALGARGFGSFAGALAFVSVAAPFSGWGAPNLVVKATAEDERAFSRYFGSGLAIVLVTGGGFVLVLLLGSRLLFDGSTLLVVIPLVAVAEVLAARVTDLAVHCYQAHERFAAGAVVVTLAAAARVVAALGLVLLGGAATPVAWGAWYLAASLATAVAALTCAVYAFGRPRLSRDATRTILREGVFYALGSSAQTIYGDIDKTMLARIGSVGVAGIYTGAYRIIGMAATPVLAFVYAANPRLFRDGKREPREVWSLACRATRYSAAYASVVGLACVLAAPLVPHVLGRSFDGSVAVLRWLAVLPVIQAVHVVAANALMGVGRQALRSGVQLGVAGLNIGLNVWLIPAYSWRGAAVATLISEGALAVGVLGLLYLTVDARARALQGARLDRVTEALS